MLSELLMSDDRVPPPKPSTMSVRPAPAVASLILTATSWWLLGLFSPLRWAHLLGTRQDELANDSQELPMRMARHLELGYRFFAFAALACALWAIWRGRPRWLGLALLPQALVALLIP